ncbi:hypothetical protein PPUJ21368_18440 [Pseudomonas putida]|nr:hypothetical protein PPUJ21368_18440 [Pseudomonas putida]
MFTTWRFTWLRPWRGGALGLWLLLHGAGVEALYKCCAVFGLALTISSVMLVLDILRVLEHWQVEAGLLLFGVLLPCVLALTFKAGFNVSKIYLSKL